MLYLVELPAHVERPEIGGRWLGPFEDFDTAEAFADEHGGSVQELEKPSSSAGSVADTVPMSNQRHTIAEALHALRSMPAAESRIGHERQTIAEGVLAGLASSGCLYPGCDHTRRTRGLCHGHYQVMRSRVRAGRVTEEELESRGLLTAKGTGGVPASDSLRAFEAGSEVRGDA